MPNPQLKLQEVVSLHEYPPVDALGCCYTISRIFQFHLHYSYFPWDLCLHCFCLCSNYCLHSLLFHHFLSFPMSYLPTSPSYEPSHMPLPSVTRVDRLAIWSRVLTLREVLTKRHNVPKARLGIRTRGEGTESQPDELWIHKTNAVIA